ncbi:hypothetical protein [Collimonas fungivorans]|uniref:hypothetical protein n=1 Tax=Collimonas fungivorans TaxID=158899 RepID=UPI0011D263BE|nr:hypothetical protein [Collimonas fungivorans]
MYNGFFKFTSASAHFVLKSFLQQTISARQPPVYAVLYNCGSHEIPIVIFCLNRFAEMEHRISVGCHNRTAAISWAVTDHLMAGVNAGNYWHLINLNHKNHDECQDPRQPLLRQCDHAGGLHQ